MRFPSLIFTTYFRYNHSGGSSYKSVCDESVIGWYRSSDVLSSEGWGCFIARKTEALESEQVEHDTKDDIKVVQPDSYQSFLQKPVMYEDNYRLVDEINS